MENMMPERSMRPPEIPGVGQDMEVAVPDVDVRKKRLSLSMPEGKK